jgi:hypothetical protein
MGLVGIPTYALWWINHSLSLYLITNIAVIYRLIPCGRNGTCRGHYKSNQVSEGRNCDAFCSVKSSRTFISQMQNFTVRMEWLWEVCGSTMAAVVSVFLSSLLPTHYRNHTVNKQVLVYEINEDSLRLIQTVVLQINQSESAVLLVWIRVVPMMSTTQTLQWSDRTVIKSIYGSSSLLKKVHLNYIFSTFR